MRFVPPPIRDVDRPLHADVRDLSTLLGTVIRRIDGDATFEAVESLRTACKQRRQASSGTDLGALLAQVDRLPIQQAARIARAFTLFFLLINTAEQIHRVRRRRSYAGQADVGHQAGSMSWAIETLKARGLGADEVARALGALEVSPVLTAHPTESTRRTVLALQARIAELLLAPLPRQVQLEQEGRTTAGERRHAPNITERPRRRPAPAPARRAWCFA